MDEVTEDDLKQLFMRLDNGSKGYLDETDLASLVSSSDHQQQDAVTQLMEHLDADKDGRVSFDDFCKGYGTGMTTKEAGSDAAAEPDFGIPLNIISDDVYTPDELDDGSPNPTQTQRVVFRHKRFGRRSVPSSSSNIVEETGHLLKPPDEQNTDIQILSPLTMSPPDSRPGSSQEHYPDLASQMESFYQAAEHYDGSRRNSKVLSWINDGKDTLFEDTGTEHHRSTTFPILNSSKTDIPAVVEAIEKKDYSIEITKADISVMCQHSGGEEETEELVELFDKLDEHRNGHIKLETFIAGVQSQQKYTANITSTPPPPAVGWTSKPIHMPTLDQSFGTPLPAKSLRSYVSASTPRQSATPLPATGAEVPLGHIPLTSFGSGTSNYVTADELASTWHKLGIDATNDEVEDFIEKLPTDQSGYISIPDLSASIESALVMDEIDHGSKKIALLSIKQEMSSLRHQVMHLSMERDKLKADASHALETSRRIVKEGDDIALEIQNMREAEKREIEKKYEGKLKEQNRSWSQEVQRMSEVYNQKAVELELLQKKHQDEIEAIKSDLEDAKVAKEQFEKAFEKVKSELAEEQKARKALQRDLSCHPESTDYDVVESLRERIRELEGAIDDDKAQRFQEENKELVDKLDVLQHEHERLKQKYFHERRRNQRLRTNQETSGRRSSNSRRLSKQDLPKSNDTIQPSVNSALSEDEEDFRSESATLLEELTEEEHQAALNRIAELEEKNSKLEAKFLEFQSTNTELTSTNKLLEKRLADSVEKEKITAQRLGQDLTKERQCSHTMSMRADVLNKENNELTESSTKLQAEMVEVNKLNCQLKDQCNELEDKLTLLNNTIKSQQSESEKHIYSLTEKHRAEMNEQQEMFNQEKEQLRNEMVELKNGLELTKQELDDKTAMLSNVVEVTRAENEEKDIRLSEEKELHESIIEQLQIDHEKDLERVTADLEDAQRAQIRYLEETKEKEAIIEQMQVEISKLKTQRAETEESQQELQELNQQCSEQIQELHKQLSLSQEKNVLLKETTTKLESDIELLKDALEKSKEENSIIKEENYRKQTEIEKLSTKLAATVSAVESDQKAIAILTDDLNEREKKIEELKGEKKLIAAERDATMKKGKENAKAVQVLKDQYKVITDGLKDKIHELKESNEKEKMAYQDKITKLESRTQELEKCQKENEQKHLEEFEKCQKENEQKHLEEKHRLEEEIRNYIATKVELERDLHSIKLEMQETHKQEIDTLQEKITHLESNLQMKITAHDEQVNSLNAQLRNVGESENAMMEKYKEHLEEITQLSKSLNEQKMAVQELTEKLETTKTIHAEEVARSKEHLSKVQSEKESLMDQLTVLQESINTSKLGIEQLHKERDENKANLIIKDEQIKEMIDDAKRTQEEKLQLEAKSRENDEELQERRAECAALQEQLSLQEQKLQEANNRYETEKVRFDKQVTSLEEKLNEQTKNVEKLTLQVQELKNAHETAVQQIDVKANNLLLEKKRLQETSDQHQTDLQTLQEAYHTLQQQLSESQIREKTILNQSEAQITAVQQEKAALETNLRETKAQYSDKVAQLEEQLENVRSENEKLEANSSQMNQQFKENELIHSKEISEMNEKVNKMKAEHQEMISRHSDENSMLQKKVISLQNDLQASNETIDELKHQLQESSADKEATENRFSQETSKLTQFARGLQSKIDILNLQLQQNTDAHDELNSKQRANEVKIDELASANADTQSSYNMMIKQLTLAKQCITQYKLKFESQLTSTLLQCNQKLDSLKDQLTLSVRNISYLQDNAVHQQAMIAEHQKEKVALEQSVLAQKMDYDNVCQQYDEQISSLQKELQDFKEKMDNKVKEYNELIPRMENDYSIKLEALQQECDRCVEKNQWLEAENKNLVEQCKQQSNDYNQLLETKDTLLDEQEQKFLSKIETLKGELSRAEDALSTKQFEIDELQQSLQNTSIQAAVMEEKLSSQEKESSVIDEPDASEEAIIKVKLANFVQQLKSKLDKLDDGNSSSRRTQANVLEATAEKDEIFLETADNAIEVSLQRLDEIQQHYTEERKHSEKECEQLKNELDDLSTRYQQLDQKLQKTQQHYVVEIEGLRQQFAVKEKLYTTSSEEKEQLEKECEKLKTEVENLEIKCQELEIKCQELKTQLQNSQQHYSVEIDTLQQQFAIKEKLHESTSKETQSTIDNLQQQEKELYTKIEVLSTELDTCKVQFAEREKIMDDNINQLEVDLQRSEEDRISQEQSNNDIIQQFKEELVKLQTLLEEEQRVSSTAQSQLDESFTTFSQEKTALKSSIVTLNEQLTTSNEEMVNLRRKSLGTESALKQLEVDYKTAKKEYNQLEEQYKTEKDEWTQRLQTLQLTNKQLSEEVSSLNRQTQHLQVQQETQVQELMVKLDTHKATKDQHHQELVDLQLSIIEQMKSLQQLKELVDSTHRTTATNDDSLDITREINALKTLCSQRPSTLNKLVIQHDEDMDLMHQEHEEEVKALKQEKYVLQQKLQEADLKWNHYITTQGQQIKEGIEEIGSSDQLLQTLFIENQQLEQAKAVMSVTIHELKQEKHAYMKIITQLAHMSCQIPTTSVSR